MRGRAARSRALALLGAILCLTLSGRARAAEPLAWKPDWPRFRPSEYVLTGVAGAASLGIYFGIRNADPPHWTGGVLFDEAVRNALRLHTRKRLGTARFTSDVFALTTVTWAVGVDSLAVPILRRTSDVAGQLVLMDTEAYALSTLITNSIFKLAGRARPSYRDCESDPYFDSLCHINDTSSFPSGHTNFAFTAAGLSCAHHLHLALYGNRAADILACTGTIALAGVTSGLRVFGDRHYVSDILLGAMIGFGVGYGVPTLLHYGKVRDSTESGQASQALQLSPMGASLGPTFSGTF
ncbi:MAG: phosphatase PAP2 family protein [Polyangiaceae bacterium]